VLPCKRYYLLQKNIEGFDDYNPYMVGYEEGLPNEYRIIDYKTLEYLRRNNKQYIANNWHLRFPYMIPTRYAYDDKPDKLIDFHSDPTYARLKELPLEMDIDQNYVPLQDNIIKFQKSNEKMPCDLYNSYIESNRFLDSRQRKREINGFDYNNSKRITFESGNGTSDSFLFGRSWILIVKKISNIVLFIDIRNEILFGISIKLQRKRHSYIKRFLSKQR
jgi:hypothetical protein